MKTIDCCCCFIYLRVNLNVSFGEAEEVASVSPSARIIG